MPDTWSTCYRIHADVYAVSDATVYKKAQQYTADSLARTLLADTASYALLYVYRPRSGVGSIVQYNLHVDDSMVCRVKFGTKCIVKLPRAGHVKVWARTEARDEVDIDVQPGHVYFPEVYCENGFARG